MEADSRSLLEPVRRPGLVALWLHAQGFWTKYGDLVLNTASPCIVGGAVLYALIVERSLEKLALAAGLSALVLGVRSALRFGMIMAPLGLPKALADAGWTGEMASRRLLDCVIRGLGEAPARGVPNPLHPLEPIPKLEVPGFKLDADQFGDLLRELVGWRRERVSGEIVSAGSDTLALRLRAWSRSVQIDEGPRPASEIDGLVESGAAELLVQLAPYNLAYAHLKDDEYDSALDAVHLSLEPGVYPPRVQARCIVLGWHILRVLGRFDQARELLLTAVQLVGPSDLVVALAVSVQLEEDGRSDEPAARAWVRFGRIASRWARSKEDLDRWVMKTAQDKGKKLQAKRDSAARSARTCRDWLLRANEACWELERASLHPRTTVRELGDGALKIAMCLKPAIDSLARVRRDDPDGHLVAEIEQLEDEFLRIAKRREELTDDRVREGIQLIGADLSHLKGQFARMDEIILGIDRSQDENAEPFGRKLIRGELRDCLRRRKQYRERKGEWTQHVWFFGAIDTVLSLSGKLETMAATKELIRTRTAEVQRGLRTVEGCGQWLLDNSPDGPPAPFSEPAGVSPPAPTAPGVRRSAVMEKLRQHRGELVQLCREVDAALRSRNGPTSA